MRRPVSRRSRPAAMAAAAAPPPLARFSIGDWPENQSVAEHTKAPLGCVLTPFADLGGAPRTPLPPACNAERCASCFAYLNPFCASRNRTWRCSLCSQRNTFPRAIPSTHAGRLTRKPAELSEVVMEYALPGRSKGFGPATASEGSAPASIPADDWPPATLFVVDVRGGDTSLCAVSTALLDGVAALPACARVGVVVVTSTTLGVYDLAAPFSHVRCVSLGVELDAVFELDELLVPLGTRRQSIRAAIERLGDVVEECCAGADETLAEPASCLGRALRALLTFVGSTALLHNTPQDEDEDELPQTLYAGLRFALFVTAPAAFSRAERESIARDAALHSVSFDVYALESGPGDALGIPALAPLASRTGGALYRSELWLDGSEKELASAVRRALSRPAALGCILRVRTSPEIAVNDEDGVFGAVLADPKLENLWHMSTCDPSDTFSMLFHFVVPNGFQSPPTLQVAFAYTIVSTAPASAHETRGRSDEGGQRATAAPDLVTERRLRVFTVQLGTSNVPKALHDSLDLPVVLKLLVHQALSVAGDGTRSTNARALVREWLVQFVVLALRSYKKRGDDVYSTLSESARLMEVLRGVFGLLHSQAIGATDATAASESASVLLRAELLCSQPESTMLAMYPTLVSFADVNTAASAPLSLSREHVVTSGAKLFVVDAHAEILVYTSVPGAPVPGELCAESASPASEAHKEVQNRRASPMRRRRPAVRACAAGHLSALHFENALLDDRVLPDGSGQGFRAFMRAIADRVASELG